MKLLFAYLKNYWRWSRSLVGGDQPDLSSSIR
jgi:hypothetical protein